MLIFILIVNFYIRPKEKEKEKKHRKSFIQDVSYRHVVIGKEEVGDYSKSYFIEYKDTFFIEKLDELVYDLYQAVEKGDSVIKEKGDAFYTVVRQDSVFKVGF
jgi:CRISPR/Cas system endoribonuclease Cas6 (RAMP superfamily)